MEAVTVIGAGLAGCEAVLQLARRGVAVELWEMRPARRSPAHRTDEPCELVCSNSLRSDSPENAVGLLKEELRRLGSPVLAAADAARVPAGDALAVDRSRFSAEIRAAIERQPGLRLVCREAEMLPEAGALTLVATGPLTTDELAGSIAAAAGRGSLHFYDAIAPVVTAESVDMSAVFRQSRWSKGDGADYLNLPLDRERYLAFVHALRAAERAPLHAFEEPRWFEGCLPIEVMADRGDDVLAFGPLKPVGLIDPRTGRRPYAVVQLRREDRAGTAYNLVGFQTRLTWPEQRRIFRTLPGLAGAEFLRLGQVHRNTFLDAPRLLAPDLSLRRLPWLFFGGQITGVEGYVESCACGLLAALAVEARARGRAFRPPPETTALGALLRHVTGEAHPEDYPYQPSNVTFGLFPPLPGRVPKGARRAALVARARADFAAWQQGRLARGVSAAGPGSVGEAGSIPSPLSMPP